MSDLERMLYLNVAKPRFDVSGEGVEGASYDGRAIEALSGAS